MSSGDRIVVAVPGLGVLLLDAQTYRAALAAGAELVTGAPAKPGVAGAPIEPLLDADDAAKQLGISARWLEDAARAGIVPHYRLGAARRFRVSEVAAHFAVAGAPTDHVSDDALNGLKTKAQNAHLSTIHPRRTSRFT